MFYLLLLNIQNFIYALLTYSFKEMKYYDKKVD